MNSLLGQIRRSIVACAECLIVSSGLYQAAAQIQVGATTPFMIVEAESGKIGGGATVRTLNPTAANMASSPEVEASGRSFVELKTSGASVSWVNPVDSCNTINIRQSIPDAPGGGGIDATLDMYVNGELRMAVPLTSKQTIVYGGNFSQNPADGNPMVFYDESRTMITGPALHKGDTIMLKKDAANTAAYYWVDCIDLESASPQARPANSLSVADYGATGTGTANTVPAFTSCCNAAKAQGKIVWVPAGKYYMTDFFRPNGVTVQGAGMWFTTLYFSNATQIRSVSANIYDLCVDANSDVRGGTDGGGGVNSAGNDYVIQRIWAIHGRWAGYWLAGTNVTLRDSRTSMCWGDGLNMNNGGGVGVNLLAENNFTRGCGDDGATIFSDGGDGIIINGAIMRNNTTNATYAANGMRIAGGKNVLVENNLICDGVHQSGLYLGTFGAAGGDLDSAIVQNNTIIRCGGSQIHGAIHVNASDPGKIVKCELSNNTVKDALYNGIYITGAVLTVTTKYRNIIDNAAQTAVLIDNGSTGSAYFDSITVLNRRPGQLSFKNNSPSTFKVTFGTNFGFPDTLHDVVTANRNEVTQRHDFSGLDISQKNGEIHIRCSLDKEVTALDFLLYDIAGRCVCRFSKVTIADGESALNMREKFLASGMYIAKITVCSGAAVVAERNVRVALP
jgi:hypothetical protein